ncbi:MAG: hypothetical protein ACYTGF_12715 [Planctomycetota bacterium]
MGLPNPDRSFDFGGRSGWSARGARYLCAGRRIGRLGLSEEAGGYLYHTVPVTACAWYKHLGDWLRGTRLRLEIADRLDATD